MSFKILNLNSTGFKILNLVSTGFKILHLDSNKNSNIDCNNVKQRIRDA
jgi:hypothetical protein